MPSAKNFFTDEQQETIISTIKEAELNTSGEIRLHMEDHTKKDPVLRAEEVFLKLKMDQTEKRNGILIYIAVKAQKLAIIGDKGIDDIVGNNFWVKEKDIIIEHFKKGEPVEGLTQAIQSIGQQLKEYFPYQKGDINELPDDISFKDS